MSKITRNLLMAFALLCAIVLVVFCFELFIINGKNKGDEDTAAVSSSSGADPDGSAQQSHEPGDTENGLPGGGGKPGSGGASPPQSTAPAGARQVRPISGDLQLVFYVDAELFNYSELNDGYLYEHTGGANTTLEISLVHLPQGLDSRAAVFLDGFVGAGGTVVGGVESVRRSSLNGVHVSGEIDGELYEAWICAFPNQNEWGYAFLLHYRTDEQKNALYDILDWMSIEPI